MQSIYLAFGGGDIGGSKSDRTDRGFGFTSYLPVSS